jgi:aminopeptidase N
MNNIFISVLLTIDANPDTKVLDTFIRWYEQPGTPMLVIDNAYLDSTTHTFFISFSQKNNHSVLPLTIPIQTSLYDKESGLLLQSSLFVLNEYQKTFQFNNITAKSVVVSPLQNFSAPVRLLFPQQTDEDLFFLIQHDTDVFSRWECQQRMTSQIILNIVNSGGADEIRKTSLPKQYVEAFKRTLLSVKVCCFHLM